MSDTKLPFLADTSAASNLPGPAGGVIPPYQPSTGTPAPGGQWPTEGAPMASPGSGLDFREGFTQSDSNGMGQQGFVQPAPAPGKASG